MLDDANIPLDCFNVVTFKVTLLKYSSFATLYHDLQTISHALRGVVLEASFCTSLKSLPRFPLEVWYVVCWDMQFGFVVVVV